jgi:hypothetical protein
MGEGEGFTVLMQEIWRRHSRKTRFGDMPKQTDTHEERHLERIIVFLWDLSKIEQYQLFQKRIGLLPWGQSRKLADAVRIVRIEGLLGVWMECATKRNDVMGGKILVANSWEGMPTSLSDLR